AAAARNEAGHLDVSRGGEENAGKHLDRRRLAGAIRANAADHLPGVDAKGDAVDRADLAVFAGEQVAERAKQAPAVAGDPEDLDQVADLDERGHVSVSNACIMPHPK